MKLVFLSILLMATSFVKAQDSSKSKAHSDTSNSIIVNGKTFAKIEIESDYPGGTNAWSKFLQANLQYPNKAVRKKIEGMVVVQFIIDKDGSVSNIEAISGPEYGGLREEAVRVIKISGNWKPAVQNGKKVKSYKKQPIQFRLQ